MTIRRALDSDIPEIVKVLKKSMGTFDLPVTDSVWKFKHKSNPFGKSFVLVAEEEEEIVGVRAFMKWQWQMGAQLFSTYRAVDTATDPVHQGKGIFKKLTLKAVELAVEEGYHFIFNTPNEKSRPGYLKMGWDPAGKLVVALRPSYPFWNRAQKKETYSRNIEATEAEREELCSNWNKRLLKTQTLFTPKSSHFLKWRYEQNPLQEYEIISTPNFYLAAYVKKRKWIKELRIAECIFINENLQEEVFKIIKKLASNFGVHFISYSPQLLKAKSLDLNGKFGPVLTLRELNLNPGEKIDLLHVERWYYSLGDLELF